MHVYRIGLLFLLTSGSVLAADASPSALLRQLPVISSSMTSCEAADNLVARAEQQAMTEMMQAQQLSMTAMMGGGPVSDKQGELIERLMDPAVTMCEMNVALSLPTDDDPHADFQQRAYAVQQATRSEIAATCPVKGKADYRDSACVTPIEKKGLQQERQLLTDYIAVANARLMKERDAYASCAEIRERLADEAEAAKLPGHFLSMAVSGRAMGWQQLETLVERHKSYCNAAVRSSEGIAMREQAL